MQKIDIDEIFCGVSDCKRNQEYYIFGFYKCFTCSLILSHPTYYCKEHIIKHGNDHKYVKYDKSNYYCEKHFSKYIKYCFTDHHNVCEQCEKEHEGHNIERYESMTPDVEKLKESLEKMEKNINNLKIVICYIK